MGTSVLRDVGTHQPVVASDCLYPVTWQQYVVPNRLELICLQISFSGILINSYYIIIITSSSQLLK